MAADEQEPTGAEMIAYLHKVRTSLFEERFQLRDLRAKVADIEAKLGPYWLKRTLLGEIARIVVDYYTLPEMIALYRYRWEVYHEHVRNGHFKPTGYRLALLDSANGLCRRWLDPYHRYPYGDVRLLRPIIGEVLIESSEWERSPHPEISARLGEWYEQLAPGGELYPSEQHLDYVTKFETFAENIVWDSRGQEQVTIVNFPAPPGTEDAADWYFTQHIVKTRANREP